MVEETGVAGENLPLPHPKSTCPATIFDNTYAAGTKFNQLKDAFTLAPVFAYDKALSNVDTSMYM